MARVIRQYRFYSDDDPRNEPANAKRENFINGSVFDSPSCYPIMQLGVQALPGTKIYMNYSVDPLVIGYTGIYELDLNDRAEIVKLMVDKQSMKNIQDNQNGYIIIDVLYEDGTGD